MSPHISIDTARISSDESYRLLTGCVVPRPIALVSSLSDTGIQNLAPFSFFNLVSTWPPTVMVSIDLEGGRLEKDTSRNIRITGELVVNLVTEAMAERMVDASLDWPEPVDEFARVGFEPVTSSIVRPPRVRESPVNLECRSVASFEFGESTAFFAEILMAHIDDSAIADGKVDPRRLDAIGRLAGTSYCSTRQVREIPRNVAAAPASNRSERTPPTGLGLRRRSQPDTE